MEPMTLAQRKKDVFQLLCDEQAKTIVLCGEAGVGKTWTAKEVSSIAKQRAVFNAVVWIYLNRRYDVDTLRDSIAQQLSLLPTRGNCELEKGHEELKELTAKELLANIKLALPKLLLVLDDEGNAMEEKEIRVLLNSLLNRDGYKVLITTRKNVTTPVMGDGRKIFPIEPLTREESVSLLKERASSNHLTQDQDIDTVAQEFVERTGYIPKAIVLMAKAFKYFSDKGGTEPLRRSLLEPSDSKVYNITDLMHSGYDLVPISILIDIQRDHQRDPKDQRFFTNSRCINHNELMAYWMMEGYLGPVSCMEKTYMKGHQFFLELIDFQVLKRVEADYVTLNPLEVEWEDFLSRTANKDYRRGYFANARLGLDCVFGNFSNWKGLVRVTHKGGVMRTLPGGRQGQNVSALILDGNSLAEDLPCKLIGSVEDLQVLAIFNPTMDVLSALSNKTVKKLYVFVLRNSRFVENLNHIYKIEMFENLTILEISGLSSLTEINNDLFKNLSKLQSLNLSSLPIALLPKSVYELKQLRWLILRDCSKFKQLSSLKNCESLMVLDCSGCTSLEDIQDRSFANKELQMINLSKTKIKILPLIANVSKLSHLLLSGCSSLNRLRSISSASSLEVIDLSNAFEFNEFFDKSLATLVKLKVLDLSGSGVSTLPSNVGNPRHLYLENCRKLDGSQIPECLASLEDLELLILSKAGINTLPPLTRLTNLRKLSVTRCSQLKEVPSMSSLEKLEVFDFSGCDALESIPDGTFDKMYRLEQLDLSGTSIKTFPSLPKLSNLRRLFLKDCKNLKRLPSIEPQSLLKLEELRMSGCKQLEEIEGNFFDGTGNLQILDLSDTLLKKLPSLSKLVKLFELHVRGCKGLNSVPGLEALTKLEILDLSGSAVSDLPLLAELSSLRWLMLKNCSSLHEFQNKEMFNVLGTSVTKLPYAISELTSLERLDLPSMGDIQVVDSKETQIEIACSEEMNSEGANEKERRPKGASKEEVKPGEKSHGLNWGISSLLAAEVSRNENRPFVSLTGSQFLLPLKKDPSLWNSSLKKFHLSVHPIEDVDLKRVLHFHGDDFVFRDIYIRHRHFSDSEEQKLLEVRGFEDYLEGIDEVLRHATQVFFLDNKFQKCSREEVEETPDSKEKEEQKIQKISTWPSFLTASNSMIIKGFWIEKCGETNTISCQEEKCKKMESVFPKEEIGKISDLLNSLEILWVSNAKHLMSVFAEVPPFDVLTNLEQLYLDCCPNLSEVLSLPQLPQKLKVLQIKYCDKLGAVFRVTAETKLQNLEILHLWELPELVSIGCDLPSLKTLKVSNCPKLHNLERTIESSESLQTLWVSNVCDLKSITKFKELEYLSLESCPKLEKVFSLSQPASNLKTLRIRCCDKLVTVFEKTTSEIKLQKLEKLHLQGLPKLKSIGATLPVETVRAIVDCLNYID